MVVAKDAAIAQQAQEIQRMNEVVVAKDAAVAQQGQEIHRLNEVIVEKDEAITRLEEEILRIHQSKWYRLGKSLKPVNYRLFYFSIKFITLAAPNYLKSSVTCRNWMIKNFR